MYSVIFDVHLMKAGFSWGVFYCDCAILVVYNIWLGHFSRRHFYIPCGALGVHQHLHSGGFYGYSFTHLQMITCNLSLLDGERNDQVERSQSSYIQTIHSHCPVCGL